MKKKTIQGLVILIALLFLVVPAVSIASPIDEEMDFYIKQQKELEQNVKKGKQIFEQLLRQKGAKIPQYGSHEYQQSLFEYADPASKFRQQDSKKWESIDAYAYDYYERNNLASVESQNIMSVEPPKEGLQKEQTDISAQSGSYNRSGAVNYAYKYVGNASDSPFYKNYNPVYHAFSSDCTNFVSQALKDGGGIPIVDAWWRPYFDKDDWFYYRAGTDAFDSKNDDQWSWSWVKVSTIYEHIKSRLGTQVPSTRDLQLGDIVQIDFANPKPDGIWDHSAIVTKINPVKITYHTTNKKDVSLDDPAFAGSSMRGLHITY